MLGSKIFVPSFLALLIGGCPKRQTTPRIVYVQPAPSVSNTTADSTAEALTIQEPAQAPAEESSPPAVISAPAPQTQPEKAKRTRPQRDSGEKPPAEPSQSTESTEPPLQLSAQGAGNAAGLQMRLDQIAAALNDLGQRTNLSEAQRRTIKDADAFRTESLDALRKRDLLRARQLADKADLLIKAVQ